MKKSHIIIGILAVVLFAAGSVYIASNKGIGDSTIIPPYQETNPVSVTPPVVTTPPVTTPPVPSAPQPKIFTMAEVQAHKSQTSCWTTINGNVYDLTPFIDQHPGGSGAIISLCGIDGTNAFNNQHGGQRRPNNELDGFIIGTLAK